MAMDAAEASWFESSEMLATFLASTPLLSESWRLCSLANTTAPTNFLITQIEKTGYVAFSGIQIAGGSDPNYRKLVPLESAGEGLFSPLLSQHNEGEDPVMVHAGMLHLFLSMYRCPSFQSQMLAILGKSKSIVITGYSIGGTTASLCALWLISYLQSISSPISVLCITFGSPLLGNESLSRAILSEKWGGYFCHVVAKHDLMPRLLFAPLASLTPQLHSLLPYWHFSMTTPSFGNLAVQPPDEHKAELFRHVLASMEVAARLVPGGGGSSFWPFGNYLFCSDEGGICVDNAASVIKMMHLMLMTGSPSCSVEDHLKYGDYVGKGSSLCLKKRSFMQGDLPESSYEAGVALALQSSGIASQDSVAIQAKACLKMARQMGRTPNLNSANLAISLANINPYRAQIEWYKATRDQSDDQMGYYDSFKLLRGASRRESQVNLNRIKLANFWDNVLSMLEKNQLPHDFHRRAKFVNASQFYKLLVEPLEIAEYYRSGKHQGHYISHGRAKRFKIFDRWWREKKVGHEESNKRSRFASLTQDSCFWARVEEAREWLDNVRRENDKRNSALLWEKIDGFERYARKLVETKEVSIDVLAKNSSYSLWVEELKQLKTQVLQFPPQFPSFLDGGVVP